MINRKKLSFLLAGVIFTTLFYGCGTPAQKTDTSPATANEITPEATTAITTGETSAVTYDITAENTAIDLVMDNQPESSYWFPSELLAWNPQNDPDLEFNKSVIPLRLRADRSILSPVNPTQNKDTNIMAISIMNSSTRGNAPNGLNKADCNTFSYWQYIDTLVYWGGSSGEGLIVPPSPDVTDAGHKNGVKVIGTIFFPQNAHGGKMEWLDEFLKKDASGNFPIVDKLITVAEVYGFDGWFMNQETEGSKEIPLTREHAKLMQEFISSFKLAAPDLDLIYYDSMTSDGFIDWQNALTDQNLSYMLGSDDLPAADSMFLNFWWTEEKYAAQKLLEASRKKAEENGLDPYSLYAGIDIQSEGTKTPINWSLFESSKNSTYTSLGVYCPNWAYTSASDMEDFWQKENDIWVNQTGDPSSSENSGDSGFKGISTYAIERTAITCLPFITNFNIGNGYSFFIKGEEVSNLDWNNRSLSDILPTYRYMITQDEGNTLKAITDLSASYYGGSSIKLYGDVHAGKTTEIALYSMNLPVTGTTVFTTTARADLPTRLDAVIELVDGSMEVLAGDCMVENKWTTVTYDLSSLTGKTIKRLSYRIAAEENRLGYTMHFGNISMTDSSEEVPGSISDVTIEDVKFDEDSMFAGVRLSFEADVPAAYYEIYRINENGTRSLLGVSNKTNFYINTLPRNLKSNQTTFEILPVTNTLQTAAGIQVTMEWPDISLPKAAFSASQTIIAPGETVTFESKCSENTESLEWSFPGADQQESSSQSPTVTYSTQGTYPVTLKALNSSGEAKASITDYIVVTQIAENGLTLLSRQKQTQASSYVNDAEAPSFAVDGDKSKKWCATGPAPHEITIDLGEIKTVSGVEISHAEAGGEGSDMNTKAYSISVSSDGSVFEEIAHITRNTLGTTYDTFAPKKARYVRLSVIKPSQGSDSAARIYEVEVYGLDEL